MIGLVQRVSTASVTVNGEVVGEIAGGLLVLLGVERDDDISKADKLLHKIINYRIFADDNGRMNRNLEQVAGELLVVSQFTLAADTSKGLRPGFSSAADPQLAQRLYHYFCKQAQTHVDTQYGQFGADMKVALINDGPVTFWLSS